MREKISACVTAGNEEQKIRRCLQSLTWCDEIVVVDSFSTDRTVEISKEFTDRVYQHEWLGYVGQKNLIREMARSPWILFLDADEEVSPELREEILARFETVTDPYVGFQFPRQVYFLGKWIRHGEWYPDIKLRLFRKDRGFSAGQEPHDHVVVDGPVQTLKGHLRHYTYDDIREHLETINRYSGITAQEKFRQGERFRWRHILFRPLLRFLRAYVLRHGFLDGTQGLIIASISAFGVFMKYAKMWELQHQPPPRADAPRT
ncbi:MAG: glycosyltransferase family 2 protein [Verrucomicrobiota bacterium]